MTELNTKDLMQNLTVESQASAGYGVAGGMAKGAVENVIKTGSEERKTNLESAVAKRKQKELEKRGASELVAKMAAGCLETIATVDSTWAGMLETRSKGRIDSAKARRDSLSKIEASRNDRLRADEAHAAVKAIGEQVSPGSVKKDREWWPARLIDAMKSGVENAMDWFHTTRVLANEAVATKYEKKSKVWSGRATNLRNAATEMRRGYPDINTEMSKKIAASAPTETQRAQATGRAESARNALDTIRNEDYFAPEAKELHDQIVAAGGDKKFARTNAAQQEWQARATGTTASI